MNYCGVERVVRDKRRNMERQFWGFMAVKDLFIHLMFELYLIEILLDVFNEY